MWSRVFIASIILFASTLASAQPIGAQPEVTKSEKAPVVTAQPGNWGMSFSFGGLAPLSVAGFNGNKVDQLLFSEIGFRAVTKHVVIPFSVGVGVMHQSPDMGASKTDAGLSLSVGVLRGFRLWRRISPYVGGQIHFSWVDPDGPSNWTIAATIGPILGVEYFVFDRVSLFAQGELTVGITAADSQVNVQLASVISGGGQLGLTFYF